MHKSLSILMSILIVLAMSASVFSSDDNQLPELETEHTLTHYSYLAPTKTEPGHIEYWYCSGCYKYFSDSAGTKEISKESTIIPVIQTDSKLNPLKLSTSKKTYKAKTLKKSKKSFTVKVTKFKGKVTYSLNDAAKAAKIKVKKKGSSSKAVKYKIIVPKKCKKGIYEVNINAAGGNGYQAGSKTIKIVVK